MKQRITTGVIAGAVFLLFLYLGSYFFHGLLLIMAIIAFDELVRMSGTKRLDGVAIVGYAAVTLFVFPWNNGQYIFGAELERWVWLTLLLMFGAMVVGKNKTPITQTAALFFGVLYIGIGFHYMAFSRWSEDGLLMTLLIFICIWVTDAGAYFTGMAIGKTPMWPAISPKKTVEGAIGGLAGSIVAALLFALVAPEIITYWHAIMLGLSIGIVGQLGDLIQSAYKRTYGVKDSGTLLPGHGGVLDRCDSWLIVFPFVALVIPFI